MAVQRFLLSAVLLSNCLVTALDPNPIFAVRPRQDGASNGSLPEVPPAVPTTGAGSSTSDVILSSPPPPSPALSISPSPPPPSSSVKDNSESLAITSSDSTTGPDTATDSHSLPAPISPSLASPPLPLNTTSGSESIFTRVPPSLPPTISDSTSSVVPPTSEPPSTSKIIECATYGLGDTSMSISTIYTTTITFTGRPEDFHPTWSTAADEAQRVTLPPCAPTSKRKGPGDAGRTGSLSPALPSVEEPVPNFSENPPNVWVTTAKTPAVEYVETPPPDYSLDPTFPIVGPSPSRIGHKVTVQNDPTGGVTIGSSTFSNIQPGETTTVKVGDDTFTIEPTAVKGPGDVSVARPVPSLAGHLPITTATIVGGLPVQVVSSTVVVAGSTFTITGTEQQTVVVTGGVDGLGKVRPTTIELGPGGVTAPGGTITFPPIYSPSPQIIVAGGELLTAIGPSIVVIHSTTFTYGPKIAPLTKVVDSDTIVIGPDGVTVHGIRIGGPDATGSGRLPTQTFEVIGGVTLTAANPSEMIVAGTTLTVGPDAESVTTLVIGSESVVAGPDGVTVGSLTVTFPLGPTVRSTVTLGPRGEAEGVGTSTRRPSQTVLMGGGQDEDEDDENAAWSLRGHSELWILWTCTAMGALVLYIL